MRTSIGTATASPKQIIPSTRLYPLASTPAPPAITSAPTAVGFVNQPFSFNVTLPARRAARRQPSPLGTGSGPLPPGLASQRRDRPHQRHADGGGRLSGRAHGDQYLRHRRVRAGHPDSQRRKRRHARTLAGPRRHQHFRSPAHRHADHHRTPNSVTLEDNTVYGNNTGERLRGYFVPPATGNYYFWLAGSNNAELWISDDAKAVNLVRRAWVTSPGTGSEAWNTSGQTHQRSPWLALVAGQSYYYEVLHNTGGVRTGASSNRRRRGLFAGRRVGTATTPGANAASCRVTCSRSTITRRPPPPPVHALFPTFPRRALP